ncbi:TPA: DUF2238 domain-containing protein, partial [Bacillus cereus]
MIRDKSKMTHLFLLLIVTAVFIWSVIKPARYSTWAAEAIPAVL